MTSLGQFGQQSKHETGLQPKPRDEDPQIHGVGITAQNKLVNEDRQTCCPESIPFT